MWSLIPTFCACLGVESHTSPKHLLKMQTSFRRISSPKHFLKCPKLERQDFWPRFLPPRPRAIFALCVHRGPFGEQKLCSLHVAVARRHMERRDASGAFSGAVGRRVGGWAKRPTSRKRRKLWAAEFHRFNRLFWTQHLQNCSKRHIFTNKMSKFQYIFLVNDIAFDEGKCNNLFFKRPVKTLSSIMVDNMVWNQVQYFTGLKVYNVPKSCGGATVPHLSCRVPFSVMSDVHVLCCMMPL